MKYMNMSHSQQNQKQFRLVGLQVIKRAKDWKTAGSILDAWDFDRGLYLYV